MNKLVAGLFAVSINVFAADAAPALDAAATSAEACYSDLRPRRLTRLPEAKPVEAAPAK